MGKSTGRFLSAIAMACLSVSAYSSFEKAYTGVPLLHYEGQVLDTKVNLTALSDFSQRNYDVKGVIYTQLIDMKLQSGDRSSRGVTIDYQNDTKRVISVRYSEFYPSQKQCELAYRNRIQMIRVNYEVYDDDFSSVTDGKNSLDVYTYCDVEAPGMGDNQYGFITVFRKVKKRRQSRLFFIIGSYNSKSSNSSLLTSESI